MHLKFTVTGGTIGFYVVGIFGYHYHYYSSCFPSGLENVMLNEYFWNQLNIHVTATFRFQTHSPSTYDHAVCHVRTYIYMYVCSCITFCNKI